MNLDKLAKQFRRDLLGNPKKAAALALMLLVALYFWGPLVGKWLASGKKRSKGNSASLILTDDPIEPTQSAKSRASGKFRWEKVRQAIHQDTRMVTATFDASWVDPFGYGSTAPEPQSAPLSSQAEIEETATPELTPETAGLALTSVLISPRLRIAMISGEAFREGDLVTARGKDKDSESKLVGVEFRVVRIRPQMVELKRGDDVFQLKLVPPSLGRGARIESGSRKPK